MKIEIRYFSQTGNTKKLADAIGTALNISAKTVEEPLNEDLDILFLGSSVYAGGVAKEIKDFINNTNVKIGKIVSFSTAALLSSTYKQVKKLAEQKGIPISEEEFHCKGSFKIMHKGKPDSSDIESVMSFAKKIANIE